MPAARRSSTTSTCNSTRTPRSACWARTARVSRRCCASWRASTPSSPARPGSRRAPRSATCSQEPQLDDSLNVLGNVMTGVKEKKDIVDRYNELMMNYSDETADEATTLQDRIDARKSVGPRSAGRRRDGSAGLPAGRCLDRQALGWRAPPRGAVRAAAEQARPAAARRTDQPSRCRDHGVARKAPARICRRGADHHPRPLLPRQCHGLDSRARSRPRRALRGQLLGLPHGQGQALRAGEIGRHRPPEGAGARKGMDRAIAAGAAVQIQGAPQGL